MSKTKRREQAARRAGFPHAKPTAAKLLRERHHEEHPNCTYGDRPHFVPPSMGQVGFFLCDPPADLTNHTRCRPPYDHESEDHR